MANISEKMANGNRRRVTSKTKYKIWKLLKNILLRCLITFPIIVLLLAQNYFFGEYDFVIFVVFLITAFLISIFTIEIYRSNRHAWSIVAKKKSWLEKFLLRPHSIGQIIICTLISLFLSMLFIVTIKGIMIGNGAVTTIIILLIFNGILYSNISHDFSSENIITKNFDKKVINHGILIMQVLVPALFLDFILTILFSFYDAYKFETAEITLMNFVEYTADSEEVVLNNGYNKYSRIFINAYLLIDNLRFAFARVIVKDFLHLDSYVVFFIIVFILNLIKLFFFSWVYVILLKGFSRIAFWVSCLLKERFNRSK